MRHTSLKYTAPEISGLWDMFPMPGTLKEDGSIDRTQMDQSGTGVVMLRAAIYGAAMNIRVNTRLMKDRAYAEKVNAKAESLVSRYGKIAEEVYERVWERLK